MTTHRLILINNFQIHIDACSNLISLVHLLINLSKVIAPHRHQHEYKIIFTNKSYLLIKKVFSKVVKYRPGGEFHLHVDFHSDEEIDEDDKLGNRVGHSMIFLQSAELGGGFAMPKFNIHITPKPGRMAHWRNVDSNGINAPMSLHGGCHVFAGNKVVAIKDYHHPFQKHWQCKKK